MSLLFYVVIILFSSAVIFFISRTFATSSSNIGEYLNLPKSVKGATFDAIAGSLPELLVALFAVIVFREFEVGVGTVAGSALFNLLVIPGLSILVAPVVFKVGNDVINRDALFYVISVFILLVLVLYFKTWGIFVALFLLLVYGWYIFVLSRDTKKVALKTKRKIKKIRKKINIKKDIWIALGCIVVIGGSTFFLTYSSIGLAEFLQVPSILIAFTVTAAATSVPDTVISVVNAKRGNIDDAVSNVFGSNIFDILVGLGLPLLIYTILKGNLVMNFDEIGIVIGLLGATILIFFMLADDDYGLLTKKHAYFMLFIYLVFILNMIFM
jgi:cation:H+ antiporter